MQFWSFALVVASLFCSPVSGVAETPRKAVVFDVDGTLTPHVYAVNRVRADAVAAVQAYADADVQIVYLTARVPMFQGGLPDWLADNGFPKGQLHLMETDADRDDHGAFKQRVLEEYRADGWTFVAAYGDSASDFAAYQAVGISQDRVFALQRVGAWACKDGDWQGCYRDWAALLPQIAVGLTD